MFYAVSKSLWFFLQPSSLLFELLAVGLLLSLRPARVVLGRRLMLAALLGLLVCGLGPVGNALILPLEERFPAPRALPEGPVAGIIVLGGYEDGRISGARATLALNEAAERLTETARLAHRMPSVKVIVSGGAGSVLLAARAATSEIRDWLVDVGVAPDRIVLESRSLTTFENAKLTAELVAPRLGQRWLLVTSAAHMPRAVGAFRAQGFDVIAWPADWRTMDRGDALRTFGSVPAGLKRVDEAAMEWLGLLAYRALGRSSALFPAP